MWNCIFCDIVSWKIPSTKIWEDENFYAFLDLFPNCRGQSLVIPKNHRDSKIFEMNDDEYMKLMHASKVVAGLLKNKLWVERTGMIIEGMWVNHAHVKLYPMHGLSDNWKPIESSEKVFYENYPWFLTTHIWEQASIEELTKIQKTII